MKFQITAENEKRSLSSTRVVFNMLKNHLPHLLSGFTFVKCPRRDCRAM